LLVAKLQLLQEAMDSESIALYCLIDDLWKAMRHYEDLECQMSDAEIMMTALVTALYFGGDWSQACRWLGSPQHKPFMLNQGCFSRRLHRVESLFLMLVVRLGEVWRKLNIDFTNSLNTFPIPVCDNIGSRRAKIHIDEPCGSFTASRRRCFYGPKLGVAG
jgi:hypothetical protein